MDNKPSPQPAAAAHMSRRTVFAGAGAVGALAAVAAALPRAKPVVAAAEPAAPAAAPAGGYELTEHVQRYYQTARI